MKVSIITEGGRNIGFGHITRCLSLCQAFEEREIVPEFFIHSNDSIGNLLKGRRCRILDWLKKKEELFKLLEDSEIAIVDSYLADICFYERLADAVKTPVYMDDNHRLDYPKGILLNGSIYAERMGYSNRGGRSCLIGSRYVPLRKTFWETATRKMKEDVGAVMVTFGGNDSRGMAPKVLRLLRENYPALKKNVVIGKAFKNIGRIEKEVDSNTTLFYYADAKKMKDVMMVSDVAISAGGQTLYELARAGIPTLGVCMIKNQELNLEGFHESGFLKFVGWYNDDNIESKIVEAMEGFLRDSKARKKAYSKGRELVDGQGAKRVVESILEKHHKERV